MSYLRYYKKVMSSLKNKIKQKLASWQAKLRIETSKIAWLEKGTVGLQIKGVS